MSVLRIYRPPNPFISTVALVLLLSACAAVKPLPEQPFDDYQQAIAQLKDRSDQALHQAATTELAQYKTQIAAGNNQKITALLLQFPPQLPYGWCYSSTDTGDTNAANVDATIADADATSPAAVADPCGGATVPSFAAIASMQQTLAAMNSQLLNYASTLTALSGADNSTQFNAQQQAQQFDQQATGLLQQFSALGVNTSGVTSQRLALFSTVAANLADNYLEHKRKDLLAEVLQAGLEPLQDFVDKAQQAIDITAQTVKTQYQNQSLKAFRAVITTSGDARQGPLDALLQLNQNTQQQLALLGSIAKAYGALPNAQRQIIAALNQDRGANLAELIVYANTIRQQYEALKASAGSTSDTSDDSKPPSS